MFVRVRLLWPFLHVDQIERYRLTAKTTHWYIFIQSAAPVTCFAIAKYLTCGEGKAIPVQAWTGREGSRRSRVPDFMTVVRIGRLYPPGNIRGTHFC